MHTWLFTTQQPRARIFKAQIHALTRQRMHNPGGITNKNDPLARRKVTDHTLPKRKPDGKSVRLKPSSALMQPAGL